MNKLSCLLEDMQEIVTSHDSGSKKVFLCSSDTPTRLTQLAYGKLLFGETISPHFHNDMEEFFFFTQGEGVYEVGEEKIELSKNTFVRIPADTNHSLRTTSQEPLEFLYFGVAL